MPTWLFCHLRGPETVAPQSKPTGGQHGPAGDECGTRISLAGTCHRYHSLNSDSSPPTSPPSDSLRLSLRLKHVPWLKPAHIHPASKTLRRRFSSYKRGTSSARQHRQQHRQHWQHRCSESSESSGSSESPWPSRARRGLFPEHSFAAKHPRDRSLTCTKETKKRQRGEHTQFRVCGVAFCRCCLSYYLTSSMMCVE